MANRVIRQVPGTLFKKDGIAALAASFSPQRLSFGDNVAAFESALALSLDGASTITFASGRASLFAILRAMGIQAGDEVVVPGYTCVVVPAAVLGIGARPVYADVTPAGTGPSLEALRASITSRTRVVVVQHTYGIPVDLNPILALTRSRRIPVIEDACHALGASYRGVPVGTIANAGFFSTEYSKMLTTGQGGFAVTRDPNLAARLRKIQEDWGPPPAERTRGILAGLATLYLLCHPRLSPLLERSESFRRFVDRLTVSTTPEERRGAMRKDALFTLPNALARVGLGQLKRARVFAARRREAAAAYRVSLKNCGVALPDVPEGADPLYLRFPVRVRKREAVLQAAASARIELGIWFEGPIHPTPPQASLLGYEPGMCPVGEELSREAINLPTHPRMTMADVARVVEIVRHATVWAGTSC